MNDLLGVVRDPATPESVHIEVGAQHQQQPTPATAAHDELSTQQQFFKKVEDVKAEMAEIRGLQREVNDLHERGKTIIKTKEVTAHQHEMQEKINQVNLVAHKVKRKVEELDKENERLRGTEGQGQGTVGERTRTAITSGLKKKLKDIMGEFSDLRVRIQDEYRELVELRLRTITGEKVSDEVVDKVIESNNAEELYQEAFMQQGRGRVLDVLAEIQERNKAVKDLEQSLMELHQIFLDMAVLVEAQGEALDNIQKQVERSVNYVNVGTKAIEEGKNYQKSTRKYMCWAAIILLIIIIIIVLAVVLSAKPWVK